MAWGTNLVGTVSVLNSPSLLNVEYKQVLQEKDQSAIRLRRIKICCRLESKPPHLARLAFQAFRPLLCKLATCVSALRSEWGVAKMHIGCCWSTRPRSIEWLLCASSSGDLPFCTSDNNDVDPPNEEIYTGSWMKQLTIYCKAGEDK